MKFLESLKAKGYKVHIFGFTPLAGSVKGAPPDLEGEVKAWIEDVAREPSKLQVYWTSLKFQIGRGDRLIDHKVETLGDW